MGMVMVSWSLCMQGAAETLMEALFTIFCFMIGIFMNAYVIGSAGSALQVRLQLQRDAHYLLTCTHVWPLRLTR